MKSTDLLNLKVKHKIFGEGIITKVSGNYLTVKFNTKESKFVYPDSFEKFIVAEDTSVQTEIMEEIMAVKRAEEEKRSAVEVARKAEKKFRKNIDDGFGADYNVKYLAKHPVLTYRQVEEQFGIKIAGFGRGINVTPSTIVLISSVVKKKGSFTYNDRWTTDGDYIYSGEGKRGDQKMTSGNKAIIDAEREGKPIHLFVKFSPQEYYYQGIFSLVDYTYEDEIDESGNIRKAYKFRLKNSL